MKEQDKEGLSFKERSLLPFYTEEVVRRYLEIKRLVLQAQKGIPVWAQEMGPQYAGTCALHTIDKISEIFSKESEEEEPPRALERWEGLTPWKVIDSVYGELMESGEILRKFGTIFLVAEDRDLHRIDRCSFGGKGVIIETASGQKIALAKVRATGDRFLTTLSGGLIYARLQKEDPETGRGGLNTIFQRAWCTENRGLIVAEEALFLDGWEVPRELAFEVEESSKYFRSRGQLGSIIFVDNEETGPSSRLEPIILIPGYKEEVVSYLLREIKKQLGIEEPSSLLGIEENVLK